MKVKALTHYDAGKGIFEKGHVHEVDEAHGKKLIAEGLVELCKGEEKAKEPIPEPIVRPKK